jgi:ABC-2 type transport system ATP-binding protein
MLGYLPQEFGVYPKSSPETMLNHFAILKGITNAKQRKEAVEALLAQTNLWDVRKEKLGNFSGGMKQRFGIAQALLGSPKLIIVDEPTAGLDPAERVRFHNLLSEIGENIVVILSTHIVEDVSDLCSQMAVISRGEVLLTGEPAKTIELLRGRVWKKIIARAELKEYETRFHVISTHLLAGKTVIHILNDGPPDQTFTEVSPDLEDVYFSTLKKSA